MAVWRLVCWLALLCVGMPAAAADIRDDHSFESRRWTQADGAPAQLTDLTQTEDGLLWLATVSGLYTFDGRQFRREQQVHGHSLLSSNVLSVLALPEGGVAAGYKFGGISLFTARGVQHFRPGKDFPPGSTMQIVRDKQGTLYASTSSGIAAFSGGKWQLVGGASFRPSFPQGLLVDASGTLWLQSDTALYTYDQQTDHFERRATVARHAIISLFSGNVRFRLPDGNFADIAPSGKMTIVPLKSPARYTELVNGPDGSTLATRDGGVAHLIRGADGILREGHFYLLRTAASKHRGTVSFYTFLLDREDNLWQSTNEGLHRLRPHRLQKIDSGDAEWFVQRGLHDEMWLGGSYRPMRRMNRDGSFQTTDIRSPNALLRLGPDTLWLGTETELWEFAGGKRRKWALPAQLVNPMGIQALARGADGSLLVSLVRAGLWRFKDGVWAQDQRVAGLNDGTPICMVTDAVGRTWLGFTDSRLGLLTSAGLDMVSDRLKVGIGHILSMAEVDGRLLVGGDNGVAWVTPDTLHRLQLQRGTMVQRVTGMVQDRSGRLWLHGDEGLHMVQPAALAQLWRDPATRLDPELFNFEDGLVGAGAPARPLPSLSLGADGRVFYATVVQVGAIDPEHIRRNPRAPDVLIRSVDTPEQTFSPVNGVRLPALTTAVDIGFTATALSIPERVRMRYRLSGVDRDWRDVQQERVAHYTNLAPGSYRFHVIAANEDGVWNARGAELAFTIAPAFWQTWWFSLLCGLLLVAAGRYLYRWRIASVRARAMLYAKAQWSATVEERSRIARSLHDNLLQAVQALMIQFHLIQTKLIREPDLQSKIEALLNYAEQLVRETRDQVMGLRHAHPEDDWTMVLRRSIASIAPDVGPKLAFTVKGDARLVSPTIVEEISAVVREAVLNSAKHAAASQISVLLEFGARTICGEIVDDGVGIASEQARHGRAGHFGIVGMRERLQRLGGRIAIRHKGAHGGTVVAFTIPVAQAWRQQEPG